MPDHDPKQDQAIPVEAQARDRTEVAMGVGIAAAVAGIVLVLFILPAEYGIDPTGLGRFTGLDALSAGGDEIDLGDRAGAIARTEPAPPSNHTFVFTLPGSQDNEYKLHMLANQSIVYSWRSTGPVNFDFHGEPDDPSRPGEFSSYEDAQATTRSGSFQAPFDGRHGWYFQNVGNDPVTVTIEVWGYYEEVGLTG